MARPGTISGKTVADVGEFGLIDVIREIVPVEDSRLVVGIGDDTAAFRPTPGTLLLSTCDIQVEGCHFRLEYISAHQLGRRSAAINLSDIGAMGGRPSYGLVSLALPPRTEVSWVQQLYHGLREEMARFGAAVIGGNLSGSSNGVVIDITLLGEVREEHLLLRGGARPDDVVLVTGSLGASTIGKLALESGLDVARPEVASVVASHLTPPARVPEGIAVAASRKATAMIDVSDGLAGDLGHICEASKVGARIVAERVPVAAQTETVAHALGADATRAALYGGEDYELIVTCPPADAAAVREAVQKETGTPVAEIGRITSASERTLLMPDGREEPLAEVGGWDHFLGKSE